MYIYTYVMCAYEIYCKGLAYAIMRLWNLVSLKSLEQTFRKCRLELLSKSWCYLHFMSPGVTSLGSLASPPHCPIWIRCFSL